MKSPDSHFYAPVLAPGFIELSEEESTHAVRVCRAKTGDILRLTDGKGHFANGTIENANPKCCRVSIQNVENSENRHPLLHLGLACLKDDANEEVALHVSEMDVASITLIRTEHSEEPKDSDLKKVIRRCELKSLVSLKQSLKAWLTEICGPISFEEWIKNYTGDIILCDMDGKSSIEKIERVTTLLVGPEGGFSPKEIETIKNYKNGKVTFLNLGKTRLRARTAAIVGVGRIIP